MAFSGLATFNFFVPGVAVGMKAAAVVSTSGLANGDLKLHFDGSATAGTSNTFAVATEEHAFINLNQAGNNGKDFDVEMIVYSNDGGRKLIAPIELDINIQKPRE